MACVCVRARLYCGVLYMRARIRRCVCGCAMYESKGTYTRRGLVCSLPDTEESAYLGRCPGGICRGHKADGKGGAARDTRDRASRHGLRCLVTLRRNVWPGRPSRQCSRAEERRGATGEGWIKRTGSRDGWNLRTGRIGSVRLRCKRVVDGLDVREAGVKLKKLGASLLIERRGQIFKNAARNGMKSFLGSL